MVVVAAVGENLPAGIVAGVPDGGADLGFQVVKNDSTTALSKHDPVRPIDDRMP